VELVEVRRVRALDDAMMIERMLVLTSRTQGAT
jgi:hypothetical protein